MTFYYSSEVTVSLTQVISSTQRFGWKVPILPTRTPRSQCAPTRCAQPATQASLPCNDHAQPATPTENSVQWPRPASHAHFPP